MGSEEDILPGEKKPWVNERILGEKVEGIKQNKILEPNTLEPTAQNSIRSW